MSEEEIINKIDKFIDTVTVILPDYSTKIPEYCIDEETWIAIKGLLDLYNKEKLNSLNLSEQLNKEKEKNKKLFEEYNKRVATIIKYEQEIKEIIDKIDVEDYYCLNEAEEDLRKLVE